MKHEDISFQKKKSLSEALKKAMKKKPFQKISVSELVTACQMNRKTFYYHFEDIYALLKWTFEQEAIEVVKHYDLMVDYEEAITFIMDYIEANEYIINCAYDSIGRDELKRFFYADFHDIVISFISQAEDMAGKYLNDDYKEFLISFYLEAITGTMIDWIKNRDKMDRQTSIDYIYTTVRKTLTVLISDSPFQKQ